MTMSDTLGHALSGASPAARDLFEAAQHQFRLYVGDPVATIDAALADSPGFTMAHVLKAYLHLLGTDPGGLPVARACLGAAEPLPATEREALHRAAARAMLEQEWREAGRLLEDLSARWPCDLLALQSGQLVDFLTGESRMIRDRIGRARPSWSEGMPGYHSILSMHAFGLEETGDYAAAETAGRRAVELERRDSWAWHAVAHCHELRNRWRDGIAWMTGDSAAWAEDNFFAVHNWWHLALFQLEEGDTDAALALYDGPVNGARSSVMLDMVDASALLWRLHLRGIALGQRPSALASVWREVGGFGAYAYNDAMAMMTFAMAGDAEGMRVIEAAQGEAAGKAGDVGRFAREAGLAAVRAVRAFAEGDYGTSVDLLRRTRPTLHRFGGSNAQRDLFDLTLLEAALRSDRRDLARALAAERLSLRPESPLSRLFVERGRKAEALAA